MQCLRYNIIENDKHHYYSLEQCRSKIVRRKLIDDMSVTPICQAFWERKFPQFRWKCIWKNARHTTRPQKKSSFLIWETVYSLGKKPFPSHDNFFNLK